MPDVVRNPHLPRSTLRRFEQDLRQ